MKVLVYGYYDDFANFFLNLRDYHKTENPNVEYHFLTPNYSGYVTWNDANRYLMGGRRYSLSCEYDVDFIASYNLLFDGKISKDKICKKISFVEYLFHKIEPDLVIISGDSRPNSRVVMEVAKKYSKKIFYFEQGPLKTTLFSDTGVTANHIAYSGSNNLQSSKNFEVKEYNIGRKQRFLDVLQVFSSDSEASINIVNSFRKLVKFNGKKLNLKDSPGCQYKILFALQVPEDVNSVFHGAFYDTFQLIRYLDAIVPDYFEIVFREHPLFKGSYERELYEYISKSDRLSLDPSYLGEPVDWSCYCCFLTLNSLMSFEAVSNGKPVGVLGRSCYSDMVNQCQNIDDLLDFLDKAIKGECASPSSVQLDRYMNDSFEKGHYRNITEGLLASVVAKLEDSI
jgi:capsular polysaccharide export protein